MQDQYSQHSEEAQARIDESLKERADVSVDVFNQAEQDIENSRSKARQRNNRQKRQAEDLAEQQKPYRETFERGLEQAGYRSEKYIVIVNGEALVRSFIVG
jgi:molecular chaperone GrpE (heat shock protein)|tara:strand:+ start:3648 stop:3950 length:303 start_codon:yes stop_codon:yes gene_type:complete